MSRSASRYVVHAPIGMGGMATVSLGRMKGDSGFARTVAIKQLHPHYVRDEHFVTMFLDEARLVARIRHPNVVPTIDLVHEENELLVVMDFVLGEALSGLAKQAHGPVPAPIAAAILINALHGLHAAHEATTEAGKPLMIVHRDVSPQNILVGVDGVARVIDFGIAKAVARVQSTAEGAIKGKLGYMAPEQIESSRDPAIDLDRRVDIWAAGVVLWECLTGKRLFTASTFGSLMSQIVVAPIPKPSKSAPVSAPLEAVVMKALEHDLQRRYATALDMANALEAAGPVATPSQVGEWVRKVGHKHIETMSALVRRVEMGAVPPASRTRASEAPHERTAPGGPMVWNANDAFPVRVPDPSESSLDGLSDAGSARPVISRRRGAIIALATVLIAAGGFAYVVARSTRSDPEPRARDDAYAASAKAVVATTATTASAATPTMSATATAPEAAPDTIGAKESEPAIDAGTGPAKQVAPAPQRRLPTPRPSRDPYGTMR